MKHQLNTLGSLRLTPYIFGLFVAAILLYIYQPQPQRWLIAAPLFLFSLNLMAAIATQAKLRHELPLLLFHLALLALTLLIAIGQLSLLKGRVELTVGQPFPGQLTEHNAGPLHHWRLDQINFILDSFTIDYSVGRKRNETRAHFRWIDKDGNLQQGVAGDHYPFIQFGYRFYTTHNKGFAPIFSWYPTTGKSFTGSVHLPAYPAHEYEQAMEWSPPGSDLKVWSQLQFDENILDMEKASQFHIPHQHHIVVRIGDTRHELKPGEGVNLPRGRLVYNELRSWMGFTVSSDWTLSWLLATCLATVLSLSWHYWHKYNRRPWRDE